MRFFLPSLGLLCLTVLVACGSGPEQRTVSPLSPPSSSLLAASGSPAPRPVTQDLHPGQARMRSAAATSTASAIIRGDYAHHPAAARFAERMAREQGFAPGEIAAVLSQARRQQWIIEFVSRPKSGKATGPTGYWTRYRAKFLTPDNIASGVRFWNRHERDLERAHRQYGVPPEYVVAILGVETRYGGYMGKHRILDALATLAFDVPRRSEFFTDELAAFLIMARNEDFDPAGPRGSYAGAMGYGQFMPSSFLKWAVDFDGDGRRDLWNPVDAIGSVANYFSAHGWRGGEPVVVRARVKGTAATPLKTGYDTRYGLENLRRQGIVPEAEVPGVQALSLIELDAAGGYQYWLGFGNFYVITRYNHSSYYAMAVHQLAESVRARRGNGPDTRLSEQARKSRQTL